MTRKFGFWRVDCSFVSVGSDGLLEAEVFDSGSLDGLMFRGFDFGQIAEMGGSCACWR